MIKGAWRWLFGEHEHKWRIFDKGKLWRAETGEDQEMIGTWYVLRCEKCGEMKSYTNVPTSGS